MELATLHLDTYKVVKLLQTKGYTEAEAEGFIQAIQEITLSGVATKSDLIETRIDLKQEIIDLRSELKQEINDLRNDMLKFQVVQTIAIIGTMVTLFQMF